MKLWLLLSITLTGCALERGARTASVDGASDAATATPPEASGGGPEASGGGPDASTAAAIQPTAPASALDAAYQRMDTRAQWWIDHTWGFVTADKHCALSCHTTLPFVVARSMSGVHSPALTNVLKIVEDRTNNWATVPPHYDFAPESSRSVEAALNAAALAVNEGLEGKKAPSPLLVKAFANAWEQLGPGGDWNWMQEDLAPFENVPAHYWGTAFVAAALAKAPAHYLDDRVNAPKLTQLKAYLTAQFPTQVLHARMMGLMASASLGGLIPEKQKRKTVADGLAAQACDGGWSMESLGVTTQAVPNAPKTPDAYATAVMMWTLAASGVSPKDHRLQLARAWLVKHQGPDGGWATTSMNQPGTAFNDGIITDAATAYAMIALHETPEFPEEQHLPALDVLYDSDAASPKPNLYDAATAKAFCKAQGYHLPSLSELTAVADANLFRCNFGKGFLWTIDQHAGGGYKTLAYDGSGDAHPRTDKGYAVCVKKLKSLK